MLLVRRQQFRHRPGTVVFTFKGPPTERDGTRRETQSTESTVRREDLGTQTNGGGSGSVLILGVREIPTTSDRLPVYKSRGKVTPTRDTIRLRVVGGKVWESNSGETRVFSGDIGVGRFVKEVEDRKGVCPTQFSSDKKTEWVVRSLTPSPLVTQNEIQSERDGSKEYGKRLQVNRVTE